MQRQIQKGRCWGDPPASLTWLLNGRNGIWHRESLFQCGFWVCRENTLWWLHLKAGLSWTANEASWMAAKQPLPPQEEPVPEKSLARQKGLNKHRSDTDLMQVPTPQGTWGEKDHLGRNSSISRKKGESKRVQRTNLWQHRIYLVLFITLSSRVHEVTLDGQGECGASAEDKEPTPNLKSALPQAVRSYCFSC